MLVKLNNIIMFALIAFFISRILYPIYISILKKYKLGKTIREVSVTGEKSKIFSQMHEHKKGTPTMGGGIFLLVMGLMIGLSYILKDYGWIKNALFNRQETYVLLFGFFSMGLIGLVDDFLNIKGHGAVKGLSAKAKLIGMVVFSAFISRWFYSRLGIDYINFRPIAGKISLGLFYPIITFFITIAIVNAINITDGLDGLAGGLMTMILFVLAVVLFFNQTYIAATVVIIVIGILVAFMFYNIHPAKIFMGDSGAFALGGLIASLLYFLNMRTGIMIPFIILFGLFIVDLCSSFLQIFWKKYFKRKLFLVAPLHHLFEKKGVNETTIVMKAWFIQGLLAAVTIILLFYQVSKTFVNYYYIRRDNSGIISQTNQFMNWFYEIKQILNFNFWLKILMEPSNKVIKILTIVAKIFFIGLLLQFFFQTLVTYKLGLDGTFWKIVWMRKEIIIIGLIAFLGRYFWKNRIGAKNFERSLTPISIYGNNSNSLYGKNLKAFFNKFPLKNFVRVFLGTIVVSFLVSVFINHSGVGTWIMSIRYSMIGFLIFIIFFAITILFFGAREINLVKRYSRIIKTLLVGSLIRRGILWLMPNLLKFAGYNQFNYEGDVGIAPPAAYYTRYDQGFVRNQFLFERPISRGFFLIALWPLFFILCFKNKSPREKFVRGGLYGLAIMSTFSRAAWAVWILQTLILILAQFPRKYWKIALRGFIPLLLLFAVVTYFGQRQIISREFSNTGHLKLVMQAFTTIGERPIRGQGAGTAGPASHQVEGIKAYNPENQYLQIWLEYGVFGFLGRLYLYGYLHYIAYKTYKEEKKNDDKITKKNKLYGTIVFAFGVGILGLSIEGLVLHSFVDRMIVYPFMALFAIAYGLYMKEKIQH